MAALGLLVAASTATAGPWSRPLVIDEAGLRPESSGLMTNAESNSSGAVLAAWTGPGLRVGMGHEPEYVSATYRPAGGRFTPVRMLADDARFLDGALNEAGGAVILIQQHFDYLLLRYLDASGAPVRDEVLERVSDPVAVELDDQGNALVLWAHRQPDELRATWVAPDGTQTEEVVSAGLERYGGRIRLTLGPDGRAAVHFLARSGTSGAWSLWELTGTAADGFGDPVALSGAETASSDPYWPAIAQNARGDMAILWAGTVRVKPAGGGWGAPEELEQSMPEGPHAISQATIAIDREGNVFVAWQHKGLTVGSYRRAGGAFGVIELLSPKPTWGLQWPRIWFDQRGNLVHTFYAEELTFDAVVRPRDGGAGQPVELGRAGQQAKAVGVASLENGSDLVFWARSVDGWAGNDPPDNALRVSTYRPEPYRPAPVVAALRARPRSFSLRLSKRAAIEVRFVPDVSHGLTRKTFVRVERAGHRGRNRIVVGKRKLRRLERRAGAGSTVRAIVTATDGRGRQSRAEQVRVVVPG